MKLYVKPNSLYLEITNKRYKENNVSNSIGIMVYEKFKNYDNVFVE